MKKIHAKRISCFRRWSRKSYNAFASLHREVTIGVLSVSMSIVLLATETVAAQTVADSVPAMRLIRLDSLGVRASSPSPIPGAVSQTPIFDRAHAAAAPIQTLEAALRLSPSIDLRERGGKGVQADISTRGGSFDQTMVMLNGIRFTDARTGHQSHSLPIDMECIDGIDLIDGVPGVGAYAGAINIRTRPLWPSYLRLEASGGDYGYAYSNLSGALTKGRLTLFGAASLRRSEGYTENTDFDNLNAYLRLGYDAGKAGYFDAQGGYQNRRFGANGFYSLAYPDQYEHTRTGLVSLRWYKTVGRLSLSASGSYRKNFDRFELVRDHPETVPYNYHNTDAAGAEFRAGLDWVAGRTSLGGDYAFDHIWSTVLGDPVADPDRKIPGTDSYYTKAKARHTGNVWLRHEKQFRQFDLSASGGVSFTPYGSSALWSASAGWNPVTGLRVEAGAAQSMRLPSFTDLYYTVPGYVSDPDLHPEQAITYRFGLQYDRSVWSTSAVVYYRSGRNIIDWIRAEGESDWRSMQITRLGTTGVELSGNYAPGGVVQVVTLSYGYLHTDKSSGSYISKYALDYMRHKVAALVTVKVLRHVTVSLTGSLYDRVGNYVDRDGKTYAYKPYFLLDGRVMWEKGGVRLYVDVTNLTNSRYFDFGGLRMPGTWATGGVALTIR